MKVGIISDANTNIYLMRFLNHYEHKYIIYYDQINRPYGDKDFEVSVKYVEQGISYLKKQGVERIIISPIYEIFFALEGQYDKLILPIFQTYVLDHCFNYSLIGKIGLFGDYADLQVAQDLITKFAQKYYKKTPQQNKIAKFHFPFKIWTKEVRMWKYFLNKLSFSNYMVNKVIKLDLKYFKDAMVDTIIPLSYGYFVYQRTISKYFTFGKQRFHKLDKINSILDVLLVKKQDNYNVELHYTGTKYFLEDEKKRMRFLCRGKEKDFLSKEIVN